MTFLAEWGDRSQIATISMGADYNALGICVGGSAGHATATALAVLGGRLMAAKISERSMGFAGGATFLLFGILACLEGAPVSRSLSWQLAAHAPPFWNRPFPGHHRARGAFFPYLGQGIVRRTSVSLRESSHVVMLLNYYYDRACLALSAGVVVYLSIAHKLFERSDSRARFPREHLFVDGRAQAQRLARSLGALCWLCA